MFLASLTTACADQRVITNTVYQPVYLPDRFLIDCPVPEWAGGTYREVGKLAVRRKTALEDCNAQLQAAREYQQRLKAQSEGLPDFTGLKK